MLVVVGGAGHALEFGGAEAGDVLEVFGEGTARLAAEITDDGLDSEVTVVLDVHESFAGYAYTGVVEQLGECGGHVLVDDL